MSTKPRTAYQQFVSDFAAQNKGQKWGPGGLMRAAAAAWRAEGNVPKAKPKSACAGKVRTNCTPPCVWTNGAKRQYCHAKAVGKGKGSGAPRPRATLSKAYHSCSKLTNPEQCDVAPHCYWKPNEKVCRTRSGAGIKQLMQGQDRQNMLAQVRSLRAQQQGEGSQMLVVEEDTARAIAERLFPGGGFNDEAIDVMEQLDGAEGSVKDIVDIIMDSDRSRNEQGWGALSLNRNVVHRVVTTVLGQ